MVKPDGVQKGLVGEVIKRIEQRDLKIIALEMFLATKEQVDDHYPKDPVWIERLGSKTLATYEKYNIDPVAELGTNDPKKIGKELRGWLLEYMTMAPMVRMVIEGIHAVDMVRKIAGDTMPYLADMGTIRGDFSVDSPALANKERRPIMNMVHASETEAEAEHEIKYWFGTSKIHEYKRFGVDN